MFRGSFVFVIYGLLFSSSAAVGQEMRTWTNADGRTVEAQFVRLDGDTVEIKNDKGAFRLPLSRLSEQDQEYAKEQGRAKPRRRAIKPENRRWSMLPPTQEGKYVRLRDGNVQILVGRQVNSYPIHLIGREDIAYIYEVLESRGDLEKLKDDPNVKNVVEREESLRRDESSERVRELSKIAAEVASSDSPPSTSLSRSSAPSEDSSPSLAIDLPAEGPPGSITIIDREWSMRFAGKENMSARLTGLRDGDVEIQAGDATQRIPILFLSSEDLLYVHEVLRSRGILESARANRSVELIVNAAPRARSLTEAAKPSPSEFPENPEPTGESIASPKAADAQMANATGATPPQAPSSPTSSPPPAAQSSRQSAPRDGIHSNDPWERDRAVMAGSNRAAYIFLSAVLAFLVLFGPVIYALQRMR